MTGKPQDNPTLISARWAVASDAVRTAYPPETIAYGAGPHQQIEWFEAMQNAPVVLFIPDANGQAPNIALHSFIAQPLLDQGVSVVITSHDPGGVSQTLRQMRQATDLIRARTGARPVVCGHGSGGHLAACLLSEGRASGAVALSGLFDLEPFSEALGLTSLVARALSPIHWPAPNGGAPGGTELDCFVGGNEDEDRQRQSRSMAEVWTRGGADARCEVLAGRDCLSLLDELSAPDSLVTRRLLALAGR